MPMFPSLISLFAAFVLLVAILVFVLMLAHGRAERRHRGVMAGQRRSSAGWPRNYGVGAACKPDLEPLSELKFSPAFIAEQNRLQAANEVRVEHWAMGDTQLSPAQYAEVNRALGDDLARQG